VLANDREYLRNYYYDFENPNYDASDPSTGTERFMRLVDRYLLLRERVYRAHRQEL
jgi:hypothetical protein